MCLHEPKRLEAVLKYDDASWHYGGDFPVGLPDIAGATHIGMFAAWAALNGLAGDLHTADFVEDLGKLRMRTITPVAWFLSACDEKLTDEDLSEEGNRFAQTYYDGAYLDDLTDAFPAYETLYHVPDSWVTYDTLEPIFCSRFEAWRRSSG